MLVNIHIEIIALIECFSYYGLILLLFKDSNIHFPKIMKCLHIHIFYIKINNRSNQIIIVHLEI